MNTEPAKDTPAATDTPAPYTPEAREKNMQEAAAKAAANGMHFSWNVRKSAPVKTPPVKQTPAKPAEKSQELPKVPAATTTPAPAKEAQEEKKAPQEQPKPAEEPVKEEEAKKEEEPKPEKTPAKEETAPATTPEEDKKPKAKKTSVGGIILDTFLFLAVFGIIGAGAWYIHGELKKYDIPSPLEVAIEEQEELCKRREVLQEPSYKADAQIVMRQKLESLVRQGEDLKRQIEEKKASIAREQSRVMALQHEIRTEDRSLRQVARSLLPGMRIGNATTTTGKVYPDAVIYRIQGNKITLRTRMGQSAFPIHQLVKDNLPDMARYAFGLDDMVDMSDFETADGKKKESKKRKGKLIAPKKPKTASRDYDPASGAPIVDTESHRNTTNTAGDILPSPQGQETWQPPTGDLPI